MGILGCRRPCLGTSEKFELASVLYQGHTTDPECRSLVNQGNNQLGSKVVSWKGLYALQNDLRALFVSSVGVPDTNCCPL